MGNKLQVLFVVIVMVFIFTTGFIYAATAVQDVIRMENKAYKEHTKAIVDFTHKKHSEEYKIGCGECHHDENGKPLNNLKMGDDVQNCIECHKIPSQMPGELKKELKAKKVSKKELTAKKLEYHAEAIHLNCIKCHKAYNKKNKTKAAPVCAPNVTPKRNSIQIL